MGYADSQTEAIDSNFSLFLKYKNHVLDMIVLNIKWQLVHPFDFKFCNNFVATRRANVKILKSEDVVHPRAQVHVLCFLRWRRH